MKMLENIGLLRMEMIGDEDVVGFMFGFKLPARFVADFLVSAVGN